jgi:hypothetical protein
MKFSNDDTKKDAIHYTVEMVGNEKFPSMHYFDTNEVFYGLEFNDPVLEGQVVTRGNYSSGTDAWINEVYYEYYDTGEEYKNIADTREGYMIMQTHRNEYYAMSDVIAYALDTMEPFYFVTIQELVESIAATVPLDASGGYDWDSRNEFNDFLDAHI